MISRQWNEADLKQAFFPVAEKRDLFWQDENKKSHRIFNHKAIVNCEDNKTLAVVANDYQLVLNETAYEWADFFIKGVFEGKSLKDFKAFNVFMPKTKGSCRIDLIIPNSTYKAFGNTKEAYTPFVRISNSYNKTLVLKYEIGFCRWICLNGCIFGQKSITFSTTHNKNSKGHLFEQWTEQTRRGIGEIGGLWNAFESKLIKLREIEVSQDMILPMFCKTFGIKVEKEKIGEKRESMLAAKSRLVTEAGKKYFEELGNNAYALYNIFTDYATYPNGGNVMTNYTHGYQRKVGIWMNDFLMQSKANGFNIKEYVGKEAMEAASSMMVLNFKYYKMVNQGSMF